MSFEKVAVLCKYVILENKNSKSLSKYKRNVFKSKTFMLYVKWTIDNIICYSKNKFP